MKKGQIAEVYIERVDFPAKAVGKIIDNEEAREIELKGGIPGQTVSAMITKVRHGKAEGRILEVIKPSEDEVPISEVCPHASLCGGCSYQTLPIDKQIELKEGQIRRLMSSFWKRQKEMGFGGEEIYEGITKCPKPTEYRNKMEFSFGDAYKGGPLSLGMHRKGSFYDILDVPQCRIVDEDYRTILTVVSDFAREKGLSFFHKMKHEGYLRHLLVRKAVRTGEILVCIVTSTAECHDELLAELKDRLLSEKYSGVIKGILHTRNDSLADVVQSDETVILYGEDCIYEEILGMKFKITEFSFFQTNSLGAEVLYEKAREYIGDVKSEKGDRPVIYDLYSGTGTIAQMMAGVAKKVIGVEIVEEAVMSAKENARINGIDNCEFIAGDVLKVLDDITQLPDFIILDPPRDGINPKALTKILSYGVDRMIYISCKPTSLARDLEVFLDNGYCATRMCSVDMFPFTSHVECIVCIQRVKDKKD